MRKTVGENPSIKLTTFLLFFFYFYFFPCFLTLLYNAVIGLSCSRLLLFFFFFLSLPVLFWIPSNVTI